MKTLTKCSVCNHGMFVEDGCRCCKNLITMKPEPVVDEIEHPKPLPVPSWLQKRRPRPAKENKYQLPHGDKAYSVMRTGHRSVLIARIRTAYKLTAEQGLVVVEAWMSDRELGKEAVRWEGKDVYERMTAALAGLYEQYGKYRRPEEL